MGHAAPVAPAAPAAEATTPGTVIPPSSPLVTQAPPHTPRPDPAGRRRLSTDRQPLLSQEVCSLLVSILGAWTQPWNFTSLEETGQPGLGILLSPCRPSPCHLCPPMPREQQESQLPWMASARDGGAEATARLGGGWPSPTLHGPPGQGEATYFMTFCSKSVWSVISLLE